MVSKLFGGARRIDAWLQNALNNGVAYVARDSISPGEVQEYLKTEVNKNLRRDENRVVWAANLYRVELSKNDFQRLQEADPHLPTELDQQLMRYIRNNGWSVSGSATVSIVINGKLSTGQFHTSSRFVKDNDRPSKFFDPSKEQEQVPQFQNNGPQAGPQAGSQARDPWAVPEQPQQPQQPHQSHQSQQPRYGQPAQSAQPAQFGQPAQPAQSAPSQGFGGYGFGQPAPQYGQPNQPAQQPTQFAQPSQPQPQQSQQPAATRQVTLQPRTGAHSAYTVQQGSANVIGRSKDADLVIDDPSVSRLHAEVSFDGESAILVDTRSSNGTSVNGMKVFNWELADGDVIELGRSILDVRIR